MNVYTQFPNKVNPEVHPAAVVCSAHCNCISWSSCSLQRLRQLCSRTAVCKQSVWCRTAALRVKQNCCVWSNCEAELLRVKQLWSTALQTHLCNIFLHALKMIFYSEFSFTAAGLRQFSISLTALCFVYLCTSLELFALFLFHVYFHKTLLIIALSIWTWF